MPQIVLFAELESKFSQITILRPAKKVSQHSARAAHYFSSSAKV